MCRSVLTTTGPGATDSMMELVEYMFLSRPLLCLVFVFRLRVFIDM